MRISYEATNFPSTSPATLIGKRTLTTSWTDLVWSAITVGKPGPSYLLAHRWHSLADLVVRTYTVYSSLRQRGSYVDRSSLYEVLDPTEKGATSYFLGMVMTKLFSDQLLGTQWLFHVSQASVAGAAISFLPGSKSQPDLVGLNRTGDWIVLEAKGRTNGFNSDALKKAKQQTTMISSINGVAPSLRVALQVYFRNQLMVRIDDPSEPDQNAVAITLDVNAALARYYAVAGVIEAKSPVREVIRDQEFVTIFDEDSGITVGIQSHLLSNISEGRFEQIRGERTGLSSQISRIDEFSAIYPDGLFVRLDARWATNLMSLEPEARDN